MAVVETVPEWLASLAKPEGIPKALRVIVKDHKNFETGSALLYHAKDVPQWRAAVISVDDLDINTNSVPDGKTAQLAKTAFLGNLLWIQNVDSALDPDTDFFEYLHYWDSQPPVISRSGPSISNTLI